MLRFFLFLIFAVFVINSEAQFAWPNGAKAAVCFTYDDGLDCHLDVVVPQLDEFGLKGTFFCTGNSESLYKRTEEWRKIAENGYELGNHTLFHPCDGTNQNWVKPEYDLNNYTVEQLITELKTANTLLKAIDGKTKRSFAYTCSNYVAGGKDFTNDLKPFFSAARCDGPIPASMRDYNIYKTPSTAMIELSAEQMIALAEEAKTKGTIVVFMFHSVGGGYLNTEAGEHYKLLKYISEHSDDYYSATFGEVMDFIQKNQEH